MISSCDFDRCIIMISSSCPHSRLAPCTIVLWQTKTSHFQVDKNIDKNKSTDNSSPLKLPNHCFCSYRCSYLRFSYHFLPRPESATFLFATTLKRRLSKSQDDDIMNSLVKELVSWWCVCRNHKMIIPLAPIRFKELVPSRVDMASVVCRWPVYYGNKIMLSWWGVCRTW